MDSAGVRVKGNGEDLESGGYRHYSRRHYFSGVALKILLLFMVIGITTLLLLDRSTANPFQRSLSFSGPKDIDTGNLYSSSPCDNHENVSSFHQLMTENLPSPAKEENELAATLRKAAMEDKKTVIITTLNAAWTEPDSIFDLFLESFRIGNGTQNLLKHVVVGAFDGTAYSRCMQKHLHCYAITTDGIDFSADKAFMSDDYLKMMWRRIDFLRNVLEMGYDFVFTDSDVMWLRDPFPRFYPDVDFQVSCDLYLDNYTDLKNSPNGGFNYVKSNSKTIQFYKFWYTGQEYYPGRHDQDVLNFIKTKPFIRKIGLEIWFLDTAYFGGFCQPTKDLDLTITMHANCCIGLGSKIHDLKMVIDDWKKYMSLPAPRNLSSRSWTVPRRCGL